MDLKHQPAKFGYDALPKIHPTNYAQWDIYNIVRDAFCVYRGIVVDTPAIKKDDFVKNMQYDSYVKVLGHHHQTGKKYIMVILEKNEKGVNEVATLTEKFKLFVNTIKDQDSDIIIVSPCDFQPHVVNFINDSGLSKRLFRYHYDRFKTVIPLGPFCSRHTLLDDKEAKEVIEYFNLKGELMKKILTDDPQVVWLGARIGQLIRIDRINPTAGKGTDYRIVSRVAAL